MGTLIASSVCHRSNRIGCYQFPRTINPHPDDNPPDENPLCIICAAIFCFTFGLTIFFNLKQEALWAKFVVIFIIVVSIILLYAACRKKETKTLPVQPSRTEGGTKNVEKKENNTLPVQPSRTEFGKANVAAFFKKLIPFLFSKKTKTSNSYCLASEMTPKIQSSLPVATYGNTILV